MSPSDEFAISVCMYSDVDNFRGQLVVSFDERRKVLDERAAERQRVPNERY